MRLKVLEVEGIEISCIHQNGCYVKVDIFNTEIQPENIKPGDALEIPDDSQVYVYLPTECKIIKEKANENDN